MISKLPPIPVQRRSHVNTGAKTRQKSMTSKVWLSSAYDKAELEFRGWKPGIRFALLVVNVSNVRGRIPFWQALRHSLVKLAKVADHWHSIRLNSSHFTAPGGDCYESRVFYDRTTVLFSLYLQNIYSTRYFSYMPEHHTPNLYKIKFNRKSSYRHSLNTVCSAWSTLKQLYLRWKSASKTNPIFKG